MCASFFVASNQQVIEQDLEAGNNQLPLEAGNSQICLEDAQLFHENGQSQMSFEARQNQMSLEVGLSHLSLQPRKPSSFVRIEMFAFNCHHYEPQANILVYFAPFNNRRTTGKVPYYKLC